MKNIHATDSDIQKFAFDQMECEPYMIQHIDSCNECKERVESYLSISTIIKEQAQPVLAYDLTKIILDQVEPYKKTKKSKSYFVSYIIMSVLGFISLTLYAGKETLEYLVDNSVLDKTYWIVSIIIFITVVIGYDLYKSFIRRIKLINTMVIS